MPVILHPTALFSLLGLKSLPFACFSIPVSNGKNRAQFLDVEMHSCLVNHKPLAPQVWVYSQEGKFQRVSCQMGEWGQEAFLSFLEKFGSHLQAGCFCSSEECQHTGSCPKDLFQLWQLIFARALLPPPSTFLCYSLPRFVPDGFFLCARSNDKKPAMPSYTFHVGLTSAAPWSLCTMCSTSSLCAAMCGPGASLPDSGWCWGVLSVVSPAPSLPFLLKGFGRTIL